MTKFVQEDAWLTEILGRKTYKISVPEDILSNSVFLREMGVLRNSPVFGYAKTAPTDLRSAHFLEEFGFRLTDTNVVFEKPIGSSGILESDGLHIRFALPEDEDTVASLAENEFQYSRFHLDEHFTKEEAGKIKGEWTRNFFKKKRGDAMIVALVDGIMAGFNQVLISSDGILTIDLIAVSSHFRRRGVAGAMIDFAERSFSPCSRYRVGTQLANTPSMRLYENMGFRSVGASYVFHFHKNRTT